MGPQNFLHSEFVRLLRIGSLSDHLGRDIRGSGYRALRPRRPRQGLCPCLYTPHVALSISTRYTSVDRRESWRHADKKWADDSAALIGRAGQ